MLFIHSTFQRAVIIAANAPLYFPLCIWNMDIVFLYTVQRLAKKFFCFAKHHPGRARQKDTQPGKRSVADLCRNLATLAPHKTDMVDKKIVDIWLRIFGRKCHFCTNKKIMFFFNLYFSDTDNEAGQTARYLLHKATKIGLLLCFLYCCQSQVALSCFPLSLIER